MTDNFNGDTPHLIRCIEALLELHAAGAMAGPRLGGHARTMLEAAAVRLGAATPSPIPEGCTPADAAFLAEAAPVLRCTSCGRKSWDAAEGNLRCSMPQPDGWRCAGMMIAADAKEDQRG